MSKKFEQLLDLVVNENMEKANELFHEIVVEMSKEIYENMIAQEQDVEDMDESMEEEEMEEGMRHSMEEEEMEEGMYGMRHSMEEEEMEEGMGEEDMEETMYDMDEAMAGGDPSDQFVDNVEDSDTSLTTAMSDDEYEDDEYEDDEIMDLKQQLEVIQNKIDQILDMESEEPEHADELANMRDSEEDESEEDKSEEDEKKFAMEQRRLTREYREKVTAGHGAERKGSAEEGDGRQGPVSSAKGRPTSDANGKNIAQGGEETGKGGMGLLKKGGEFVPSGTQNVGSTKTKGYTEHVKKPANKPDHEKSLLGK